MRRIRNPRFAPEFLERRLNPSELLPVQSPPVLIATDPEPDPSPVDPLPYPTDPSLPPLPFPTPPVGPAIPY